MDEDEQLPKAFCIETYVGFDGLEAAVVTSSGTWYRDSSQEDRKGHVEVPGGSNSDPPECLFVHFLVQPHVRSSGALPVTINVVSKGGDRSKPIIGPLSFLLLEIEQCRFGKPLCAFQRVRGRISVFDLRQFKTAALPITSGLWKSHLASSRFSDSSRSKDRSFKIAKSLQICLDDLIPHFRTPRAQVAEVFCVSLSVFKKICRLRGIRYWPYRKLKLLQQRTRYPDLSAGKAFGSTLPTSAKFLDIEVLADCLHPDAFYRYMQLDEAGHS
ncbi:hypothetical protein NDN08_001763 [Rhodosorus marinus]|uniref:RWP-RK domain-containing protein n=1 Tax=Rhodosorus marinus TaxID=101924 RepID=A0AAV8URR1_9RHOD|nr:hypothetical protein NDN08_001763 [Rhodosorus marinus]